MKRSGLPSASIIALILALRPPRDLSRNRCSAGRSKSAKTALVHRTGGLFRLVRALSATLYLYLLIK
jgi:hypothetical protein